MNIVHPIIYCYKWVDGNLDKCEYQVYGHKMNFDYLRHKLFKKHKPYMRLTSEDVITKLSFEELSQRVSKFEAIETNDCEYLMKCLKKVEHTGIFLCGMTTLLFFPGGTS